MIRKWILTITKHALALASAINFLYFLLLLAMDRQAGVDLFRGYITAQEYSQVHLSGWEILVLLTVSVLCAGGAVSCQIWLEDLEPPKKIYQGKAILN